MNVTKTSSIPEKENVRQKQGSRLKEEKNNLTKTNFNTEWN